MLQRRSGGRTINRQEERRSAAAPSPLAPFAGAPEPALRSDPFAASDPTPDEPGERRQSGAGFAVFATDGHLLAVTEERRERFCSLIGLMVKLGLLAVTGVSLVQISTTYQQRMDSNGEIVAVLELEKARLERARQRFDALFNVDGEQRLIREQSQWIAPNRLRVIWQSAEAPARPQPRP